MTCILFPLVSMDVGALIGLVEQGRERRVCATSWSPLPIWSVQGDRSGAVRHGTRIHSQPRLFDPYAVTHPRLLEPLEKAPGTRCSARPDFLYAGGHPPHSGPTGRHKLDHSNTVRDTLTETRSPALVGFSARVASLLDPSGAYQQ